MKRRTCGDGGGGDDGDGDEVVDVAAAAADAAYRLGRPAAGGRHPAGSRGSLLGDPWHHTSGSCPPSGSRCL